MFSASTALAQAEVKASEPSHVEDAAVASTAGLIFPGIGSMTRGDGAGGVFHAFVGFQAIGFFIVPTLARANDDWEGPRRDVAIASAATLFALNYFASIARAGRPLDESGTPTSSMRLRLGISTVAGARLSSYDSTGATGTVGQLLSLGIMLGSVVEFGAVVESGFGDFDEDDYGISLGGQVTLHLGGNEHLHPYLGFSLGFHPDTPLIGVKTGVALTLSPSIEMMMGVRTDFSTAGELDRARSTAQLGFVRAF